MSNQDSTKIQTVLECSRYLVSCADALEELAERETGPLSDITILALHQQAQTMRQAADMVLNVMLENADDA